ncbi:MAG TPA: hypothetical protein VIU62_17100 [Chloroflexota bacterium]
MASAGTRSLVGNSGGAIDSFNFTVPPPVAAPTVTVTFSPSSLADGNQAGFVVRLDGTQVGTGGPTSTAGILSYTLPQTPTGIASVQVFTYSAMPSTFTIQSSGVPANVANGPAVNNSNAAQAVPLNGSLSESLPAATGGAFAYFTFPSPGASPPSTVSLSYSPADARVNQAVGFNVIDAYNNNIGSATQPANQNQASATLTLDLSRTTGEPLSIQVFNYARGVPITYRLTVSGIAPAFATAPVAAAAAGGAPSAASAGPGATSSFQPFWVENFVTTPIWSGPDAAAISFGNQAQFSAFLVVKAQTGSRLYIFNPRSGNYGYVDAAAVGPSGPPASP